MSDLVHAGEHIGVGPTFVFVNDRDRVGWTLTNHVEQISKCRGEFGEDASWLSENHGLGDLKWHVGPRKYRYCLFECHTHGESLPTTVGETLRDR